MNFLSMLRSRLSDIILLVVWTALILLVCTIHKPTGALFDMVTSPDNGDPEFQRVEGTVMDAGFRVKAQVAINGVVDADSVQIVKIYDPAAWHAELDSTMSDYHFVIEEVLSGDLTPTSNDAEAYDLVVTAYYVDDELYHETCGKMTYIVHFIDITTGEALASDIILFDQDLGVKALPVLPLHDYIPVIPAEEHLIGAVTLVKQGLAWDPFCIEESIYYLPRAIITEFSGETETPSIAEPPITENPTSRHLS